MNYTANYHLTQWDADDRIMMEDFNDNNAKLDAALKAANDRIDTLGTSKANAAALGAETTARQNADTALGGRIDSEAQARENADSAEATARASADTALQNNIDAEAAARAAADAAINANLGSHGHNARIVFGTYAGNDKSGSHNPTTLNFDFHPAMVAVQNPIFASSPPALFLRELTGVNSATYSNGSCTVSWGTNSVSWYGESAQHQMNQTGRTYYYVAIGYDE